MSALSSMPQQYLEGTVNFFGYDLKVTPAVLIPRPETELLVEKVILLARDLDRPGPVSILDLCTGSGNIAISLTKELKRSTITASDISASALALARENANLNGVADRIQFIESDLFRSINGRFDVIVSNPPYVAREDFPGLEPEVLAEPALALDGGPGGLEVIGRIIDASPLYLDEGGFLVMEIGFGQDDAVRDLIEKNGNFYFIEIKKDYAGIGRIMTAERRKSDRAHG